MTFGRSLSGSWGNETLAGTEGDDVLYGGPGGADVLNGGGGDDTFLVRSGDIGSLVVNGGDGVDTILGSAGDDVIRLRAFGPANRVERIDGGAGVNRILAGSSTGTVLDLSTVELRNIAAITGNWGDDRLTGGDLSDFVFGHFGNDSLDGAGGSDLLQGGAGNDRLNDVNGEGLFDGGAGNDTLTGGAADDLFAGGTGNDSIVTGNGADVILFNRGDGLDTVTTGTRPTATLSLGGALTYDSLSLRKNANDLLLDIGAADRVTFKDWYAGAGNPGVLNLQIVAEAMAAFNASSSDPMLNRKVQRFDFAGLVGAFDQARAATPFLSQWDVNQALMQFHLGGSDSEAIGGDLAYQYSRNGNFTGFGVEAAQTVLGSPSFGIQAQALHAVGEVFAGATRLK